VVIRSADPELQLQGLRTALSLALGDRPADVYLVGAGRGVLTAADDSEAGRCLVALREAGIPTLVEAGMPDDLHSPDVISRAELVSRAGEASFQQIF
jgi:hypothetical protein